jgi:ABC-type sugar transport system ATPase subunit
VTTIVPDADIEGSGSPPVVLRAEGITKLFEGNRVLDGVDFTCRSGEIHALLGANGAGKSTLIQVITGVYHPDGGTLWLDGEEVRFHNPGEAVRWGVSAVYQELSLVDELDVAQNVFLGREPRRGLALDRRALYGQCRALFDRYGLDLDPRAATASLSLARRQLVELAKALARDARLVILDEPTAALTASEQELLFKTLADLRASGTAIIYVSHRLEEIFRIADRVTILRDGRLVKSEPIGALTRSQVIEAMVGAGVVAPPRPPAAQRSRESTVPVLAVASLAGRKFTDITFDVWPGEILGVSGLIGSGRSSLLRSLFGAERTTAGSVRLNGAPLNLSSVRRATRAGIALVTDDRKRTGLAVNLAIHQNLNAVHLRSRFGLLNPRRARSRARDVAKSVTLERDTRDPTRVLSGGNQQKVAVGKWLAGRPRVLLCDEPTQGIDVGARADLYRLLRDLAESGVAIIVASSDMDELLSLTDRIVVMAQGRIVAEYLAEAATEELLMRAATQTLDVEEDRSFPSNAAAGPFDHPSLV